MSTITGKWYNTYVGLLWIDPRRTATNLALVADILFFSKDTGKEIIMKKSFYLHIDTLDVLDHLSDEQAGQLFKAIQAHHKNTEYEIPQLLKVAFTPFKNQFSRDHEKYESICERNRINGAKGGRPITQKTQVVNDETQNNPNNHDKDKDKEKDKDKDINLKNTPSSKMNGQVPFQQIIDLYHEMLPQLPKVEKLTTTRKGYIRQRYIEDLPDLKNWENYFDYVTQSDFLMGRTAPTNGRPPFRASLEWLTKPANYAKVAEENYHGI